MQGHPSHYRWEIIPREAFLSPLFVGETRTTSGDQIRKFYLAKDGMSPDLSKWGRKWDKVRWENVEGQWKSGLDGRNWRYESAKHQLLAACERKPVGKIWDLIWRAIWEGLILVICTGPLEDCQEFCQHRDSLKLLVARWWDWFTGGEAEAQDSYLPHSSPSATFYWVYFHSLYAKMTSSKDKISANAII